jgi:hypothetical protein
MMNGLPVDEHEIDGFQHAPIVDKISDNTAQQIFQTLGGKPVKTQKEEVDRIREELTADINAAPDDKAKREKLKNILVPMARTLGQRYDLRNQLDTAKLDDLLNEFNALFAEVNRPELTVDGDQPTPADPNFRKTSFGLLLPRDRRAAIAHLLLNVKQDDDNYLLRLQAVLGLKEFNDAMRVQADALTDMADRVKFEMLGDRSAFEVDYQAKLDDLRDLVEATADQQTFLENQQKLKKDHEKLAEGRKSDVEEAKKKLADSRAKIAAMLLEQAEREAKLFAAQRDLGSLAADNEKKEREIRTLEKVKIRSK